MVMPGYPINHRLLPVIALSLRILQIEGLESIPLSNMILDVWCTKSRHPEPLLLANHSFKWVEEGQLDQCNHQCSYKTTENPVHCQVHLFLRKKKWWSADAVGQRGDRTEVRRTDTSDCSSMTIHEGWTNLQGLALPISDESFRRCDKISLLSDFRSGLKFPFTVQAALGWELSAGRTQSVPVPETVVTGLSEPIFAARSPIQKGKSRVEFQADRHKVPMRTSHWWGEPQSQQDLTWSNVNNRCNSHTTSN